jgi:hypothetical protein
MKLYSKKKILSTIVFFFVVKLMSAQINLGIGAAVVPEKLQFGLQVRSGVYATEKIAFSGAFTYYFKKENVFGVDLDTQFKIIEISDVKISPLAGINIRQVDAKINTALQLGFFIEIPKNSYHLYIEPKAILDNNSVISIAGGLYF